MLTIEMINAARDRIASRIHRTPVMTSKLFNEAAGKVFFKCENLQALVLLRSEAPLTRSYLLQPMKGKEALSLSHQEIMPRLLRVGW